MVEAIKVSEPKATNIPTPLFPFVLIFFMVSAGKVTKLSAAGKLAGRPILVKIARCLYLVIGSFFL